MPLFVAQEFDYHIRLHCAFATKDDDTYLVNATVLLDDKVERGSIMA